MIGDDWSEKAKISMIKSYFRHIPSADVDLISHDLGVNPRAAQNELNSLVEEGYLEVNNGWYRRIEDDK